MQVSSKWRTASLVAGALLTGSVIGPPLVQAASAGLVRIEGSRSTNVAVVSRKGQLSVNAGLTTTAAGQLTVAPASPLNIVVATGGLFCAAGGFYAPPKGKALIITGADFILESSAPGAHQQLLEVGPRATPCQSFAAAAAATDSLATQNQVFDPGIPVPAGDAVGLEGSNEDGIIGIYGYLVPASAVPRDALKNLPTTPGGGLPAVKLRH
jgi:hypothetical protein